MDSFVPAGKLKRRRPVSSYSVSSCGHCPMDILLEELCTFPDVNALVVGVGECVYYGAKQPFPQGCRSWGFALTDNEIVFGDTSDLENALDQIRDNGLTTVCVTTCIPSIMDLDLEDAVMSRENVVLVKSPDYTQICSTDILSELYLQLGKELALHPGGAQIWNEVGSIEELREKLTASVHVVNDRRFLDMLRYFEKDGLTLIDNTVFHPLAFYEEHRELLGIDPGKLQELRRIVRRLAESGKTFSIKSRHAAALAVFFHSEHIPMEYIVTDGTDPYTYAACADIGKDLKVSLDFSTPLPEGNALVLHSIGARQDFDTLYMLMQEADALWD